MGKKTILAIVAVSVIAIGAASFIMSRNKEPALEITGHETETTHGNSNTPIQFGENEGDGRPDYTASEYIKSDGYTPAEKATENTPETEQVSDADVMEELYRRANEAGISTDEPLENKDAAIISNQKYQTIDEYKAYLKKAVAEKKAFLKKSDAFAEYINNVAENSELTEIPSELKKYEDEYVEQHLEERARMFGTTLDQIKEQGMYDTFKQTAIDQNEASIKTEMYVKYIAEQEGITLEDGDTDKMLEFYRLIYGDAYVGQMKADYSDAQLDTETLHYKVITTLF